MFWRGGDLWYNEGMKILSEAIKKGDLAKSEAIFDGPMVKGVADIEKELLAVDAGLHADLEKMLLDQGSKQDMLWGINLWYEDEGEDLVEFDSMINVRPRQGNRTRDVEDEAVRKRIYEVVDKWIQ